MMKYVISDQDEFALGCGVFHKDLAAGFKGRVIAAGYCILEGAQVHVSGKSAGFGIAAQPEDAAHLALLMRKGENDEHEA